MGLGGWWHAKVNGLRPSFGEQVAAIDAAIAASSRRAINWLFPGVITLLVAGATILLALGFKTEFPVLIWRVILIDYLIFFLGWLAGWNAANRWRSNQDFLCELTMTNLSPAVIGNLLFAGQLGVWWKCFLFLAVVDVLTLVMLVWAHFPSEFVAGYIALSIPFWIPTMLLVAWFHLETMRLAHWMFAITALPGLSLPQRAVVMLMQVGLFVTGLTILGSMITGVLWMMTVGVMAVGLSGLGIQRVGTSSMMEFVVGTTSPAWYLSALLGLLTVGSIKLWISRSYERAFWERLLMFTWWGAAERNHPADYPAIYRTRAKQYSAQLWRDMFKAPAVSTGPSGAPQS